MMKPSPNIATSPSRIANRAATRYVGLHGGAQAWGLSEIFVNNPHILIITPNATKAEDFLADLQFFYPSTELLGLPAWDPLPFEPVSPQLIISSQRLRAALAMGSPSRSVAVIPVQALMQLMMPPHIIKPLCFKLCPGTSLTKDDLITKLVDCGFQKASSVEDIGDIAIRGNVVDFFPAHSLLPIRVEFAGSEISRLSYFEAESQRSTEPCQEIEVAPVKELIPKSRLEIDRGFLDAGLKHIKARGRELGVPPRDIGKALSAWRSGNDYPGIELLHAIACTEHSTILDYLLPETPIVFKDKLECLRAADDFWTTICEREERLHEEQSLFPKKESQYLNPTMLEDLCRSRICHSIDQIELIDEIEAQEVVRFETISNTSLSIRLQSKAGSGNALKPLAETVRKLRKADYNIGFVVGSQQRADRLSKILLGLNLEAQQVDGGGEGWLANPRRFPLSILQGHLSTGFQLPKEKLAIIAEGEIFTERSYRKASKARTSLKKLMNSLAQLTEDDYVVHLDYGVGLYRGLKHLTIEGTEGDFLHIDYADSRLYLPVQSIGKIQKFSAAEGQVPSLDKLGAATWTKTKNKVRESVITLAGDLIKLYAARSVTKGWRFEPNGSEDDRFADGFPFDETPDQMRSIDEALADMASDRPMDRLVCGDVGFGKTEVALRAAFKCTQHVRQVAVLVPTTILVEQHFNNFVSRFAGYPVKIGAVSRFYSNADNKRTLASLASGDMDIIIGTHRLLSRDVKFKDLGLVVIDEEHRFGVKQKELLKQIKKQVDVLTLTATPIPRTLHMSLLSIRDISIISTPPTDRRVIRTYVAEQNDALMRDTILRELQRDGQCFVIHNRIQGIDLFTANLAQLVPEARFEFAHGQMNEHQLEDIMQRFLSKKTDVLVCTTIVESGLDIPNANTIIIDRADTFGLAQLYQLRGRVGRSTRQAYAYLMIPHVKKLSADAHKRLKVLQSLDDLGLGFNLAVRDLEIRGAGNLLGKEQSGSVLSVGFELYSKILKEAVLNLKGEELALEESIDPEVKIGSEAYIPDHYIPDVPERLVLYQRLASLQSDLESQDLSSEIEDRFGPMPAEVKNLVELMRLRSFLKRAGAVKVELSGLRLVINLSPRAPINSQMIVQMVQQEPTKYKFSKNMTLTAFLEKETAARRERVINTIYALFDRITLQTAN